MTEFPAPKYIEDLNCHEVWAETVQVLNGPVGTVRVELCVNRWTHEAPVHIDRIVPVARIAMHVVVAQMLRDHLTNLLAAVEQQNQLAQAPAASPTRN